MLIDAFTKHNIALQRLAQTEVNSIYDYLNILQRQANAAIYAGYTNVEIKEMLRKSVQELPKTAIENLLDYAEYESDFSGKVLQKYTGIEAAIVSRDQLATALADGTMSINLDDDTVYGKSLETAYKQYAMRKADEITQIIKDGNIQGLTESEIVANVAERIDGLQTTQAMALATTSTKYVSSVARVEAAKSAGIEYMQWISVLDNETTDYCIEHDSKIYTIDNCPEPPAHWNCRSDIIPYEDNGDDFEISDD